MSKRISAWRSSIDHEQAQDVRLLEHLPSVRLVSGVELERVLIQVEHGTGGMVLQPLQAIHATSSTAPIVRSFTAIKRRRIDRQARAGSTPRRCRA